MKRYKDSLLIAGIIVFVAGNVLFMLSVLNTLFQYHMLEYSLFSYINVENDKIRLLMNGEAALVSVMVLFWCNRNGKEIKSVSYFTVLICGLYSVSLVKNAIGSFIGEVYVYFINYRFYRMLGGNDFFSSLSMPSVKDIFSLVLRITGSILIIVAAADFLKKEKTSNITYSATENCLPRENNTY